MARKLVLALALVTTLIAWTQQATPKTDAQETIQPTTGSKSAQAGPEVATSEPNVATNAKELEHLQLAKMLQKYDLACRDGDKGKALTWAVKALAIDPTCFQKRRTEVRTNFPSSRADKGKLQGDWKVVGIESDGERVELGVGDTWTFDGDRLIFPEPSFAGASFKLDTTKSPNRISFIFWSVTGKVGKVNGIYSLNGDDLKICLGMVSPPPNTFVTKRGSDLELWTLKRQKPGKKEK